MTDELRPVRRIITGEDTQGRSRFVDDGASPATRTVPERPGYRVANLWITGDTPAPIAEPDRITEHKGVSPPKRGTVIRMIDIPPEAADPAERQRQAAATFGQLFKDADHRPGKHPGMHKTETIDYAIMIEGELTAIMDDGETVMRPGDVLIQRGTMHAWANRSGKPCRICFVLIDGKR